MSRVVIVTDTVSDLPPDLAASLGIRIVPLTVSFGADSFRVNVDLSLDEFWVRMTAPETPFPKTAAPAPGDFFTVFDEAFAGGAESVVCISASEELSATVKSARLAAGMRPDKEIHVIDSRCASAGEGMLARIGVEMAAAGASGKEIAETLERRKGDLEVFIALDTLEYLKRGGRISGTRAAVGTLLSVKPIVTVEDGKVENVDRVRSRAKARERTLELLTQWPLERATILHTANADVEPFYAEFLGRSGLTAEQAPLMMVGASVGPHVGPGAVGGVVLRRA